MSTNKTKDKKLAKAVIVSVGVILLGGGLGPLIIDYYSSEPEESKDNIVQAPVSKQPIQTTPIEKQRSSVHNTSKKIPVSAIADNTEMVPTNEPLPELYSSDEFVLDKIETEAQPLIVPDDVISNSVVFIDNFSRGDLVSKFSPLMKPKSAFSVENIDNTLIMDEQSYQRYDTYAHIISKIDVDEFMALYKRLTPLIDQAYQDIGYAHGSFNQTFNNAIMQVLETPIIRYDIKLTSDTVTYKFFDENLELLPDTQKLMLRMGPDNLQLVQQKLEDILGELQEL